MAETHSGTPTPKCTHSDWDIDDAIVGLGYCPICQADELRSLRADRDKLLEALQIEKTYWSAVRHSPRYDAGEKATAIERLHFIDEALQSSTGAA